MPKPLFTRLAAICAVGLFCVLFGGVYALSQKDTILLVMSLLLGVCCIIRFLLLYQAVKAENYRVLEGICVKREKSPLTRNQQVLFRTSDGKEYRPAAFPQYGMPCSDQTCQLHNPYKSR